MAPRVDRPYGYHWLRWNFFDNWRSDSRRQVLWDFVRQLRKIPRGALAIDCGANVGDVSSAFVRQGLRVHAFEPDPYAVASLTRRFAGNKQVTIHPSAVGAQAGRATLYRAPEFEAHPGKASLSSTLLHRGRHAAAQEVDVIDIGDFIEALPEPVAILKVDVEGAEVEIMERLIDRRLDRKVGMIYVETHEKHSPELAARTAALRRRVADVGIANLNLDWH